METAHEAVNDIIRLLDMFDAIGRFENANVYAGVDEGFVVASNVLAQLREKWQDGADIEPEFKKLADEMRTLVDRRRHELEVALEQSDRIAKEFTEMNADAAKWKLLEQYARGEHTQLFEFIADNDPQVRKVIERLRRG